MYEIPVKNLIAKHIAEKADVSHEEGMRAVKEYAAMISYLNLSEEFIATMVVDCINSGVTPLHALRTVKNVTDGNLEDYF